MQPEFSDSSFERGATFEQVRDLLGRYGVRAVTTDKSNLCDTDIFTLSAEIVFQSEPAFLMFQWRNSSDYIPRFRVCGGIKSGSASIFIELIPLEFDEAYKAIGYYEECLEAALAGALPPHLLPEQNVWKSIPIPPPPAMFKNQIPLYQVIEQYELRNGRELLKVSRSFDGASYGYMVNYSDADIEEFVQCREEEVVATNCRTKRSAALKNVDVDSLSPEEFLRLCFAPREPIPQTFTNLLRYEPQLRELPYPEVVESMFQKLKEGIQ